MMSFSFCFGGDLFQTEMEGANKGNAFYQWQLGLRYYYGYEVPQDREKAIYWIEKADSQGFKEATAELANIYYLDENNENYQKAFFYAEKADAHQILGMLYYGGHGVFQNKHKASDYFERGANLGVASSQFMLGIMYAVGDGVEEDYIKAYKLLTLAAIQGSKMAESKITALRAMMTPDQIKQAREETTGLWVQSKQRKEAIKSLEQSNKEKRTFPTLEELDQIEANLKKIDAQKGTKN